MAKRCKGMCGRLWGERVANRSRVFIEHCSLFIQQTVMMSWAQRNVPRNKIKRIKFASSLPNGNTILI